MSNFAGLRKGARLESVASLSLSQDASAERPEL